MEAHHKAQTKLVNLQQMARKSGLLDSKRTLHFIHFNDVYNVHQTANTVGAAKFISAVRQFPGHHVVFSGDAFAPSVLSSMLKGRNMVPVLKSLGVEVACIGNHDLDYGIEELTQLMRETEFPWLMSNMADKTTGRLLANAHETHEVLDGPSGLKIGYVGVGEEEWIHTLATEVDKSRILYTPQHEVARRLGKYLKEVKKCDFVLALTHMRIPNDERFCDQTHDIVDMSLGGHDHTDYYTARRGMFFGKSGTDFRMFSKIDVHFFANSAQRSRFASALEFLSEKLPGTCPAPGEMLVSEDKNEMWVVPSKYHPYLVRVQKVDVASIPGLKPNPKIEAYISGLVGELEIIQAQQIGSTGVVLDARFKSIRTEPTNLTCFFADLILQETKTDFVIINCGTLRADALMPAGPFCRREIHQLLPMHDPLVKLKLTGQQVLRALENGVSSYPKLEGRWPMVAGLKFAYDPKRPPNARIIKDSIVLTAGGSLKPHKIYTVTTKGFIAAGGDGYSVFPEGTRYDDDYDIVLSQLSKLSVTLVVSYFEKLRVPAAHLMEDVYKGVRVGPSMPATAQYDPGFKCIKLAPINDERIRRL